MIKIKLVIIMLWLSFLFLIPSASSGIYRYEDEKGTIHFSGTHRDLRVSPETPVESEFRKTLLKNDITIYLEELQCCHEPCYEKPKKAINGFMPKAMQRLKRIISRIKWLLS